MSRAGVVLVGVILGLACTSGAAEVTQTDWSGGGGQTGPVMAWSDRFDAADGVSWRSIPGQIALSSTPVADPRKHLIADGLPGAYGLYVSDVDQDGDQDVVVTTDQLGQVIVYFNDGATPVGWTAQTVDDAFFGGTSVHAADLDQDGDVDLVGASQTPDNDLVWWRNDGGQPITWTRFVINYSLAVGCNVFAGDVDGDGDMDVLSTSWSGRYVGWWRNDGGDPIVWTRVLVASGTSGAHSAVAADLDGDGDLDIVATAAANNKVLVLVNEGGDPVVWSERVLSSTMTGVRYAAAADLDGDDNLDVVAAAWDGQLRWWRNDGGDPAGWSDQLVDDTCLGGHYVAVADLDGDGANDVLVVAYEAGSILWYRNSGGAPLTWTRHVVQSPLVNPMTAFPGDVDGDGDLDVVGTTWTGGEVAWWEVTEFAGSGWMESALLDLGTGSARATVAWDNQEPAAGGLQIRVRSSDDASALGAWSDPVAAGIDMGPVARFLQYRVEMTTDDPSQSPVLGEVRVDAGGGATECTPGPTTLCLNQSRFMCRVQWRDQADRTGWGNVVPYGSDDSGILWFFDAANWEMLLKVLDGCGVNGHYWVFAAATTNVEYTLTVTDTVSGEVRTYTNPLGVSAAALTDTSAFAGCR